MRVWTSIILCCGLVVKMLGQACCSGGTPLASNLGIQILPQKTWQFQLSYDYNTQQDLMQEDVRLDDRTRHRDTHSALLRVSYSFHPRWSVSHLVSWIRQEEKIFRPSADFFLAGQGIGDMVSLLQYNVLNLPSSSLALAMGVKWPTGIIDRRDNRRLLLNPDLQPGTGAWDGLASIFYARQHIFKPNLTFFVNSTYRWTQEAQRFEGQQLYEFGNEWVSWIGLKDRFLVKSLLLDPSLALKYRQTARDLSFRSEVPNTGGRWIHLLPGVDFILSPQWLIGLSGEIPVYRKLDGVQLTTTSRITLSLGYTLSEKKDGIEPDLITFPSN